MEQTQLYGRCTGWRRRSPAAAAPSPTAPRGRTHASHHGEQADHPVAGSRHRSAAARGQSRSGGAGAAAPARRPARAVRRHRRPPAQGRRRRPGRRPREDRGGAAPAAERQRRHRPRPLAVPRAAPRAQRRGGAGQRPGRRVRLHRAPAGRPGRRGRRGRLGPDQRRCHPGRAAGRLPHRARHQEGDHRRPGGDLPGAGEVRRRPHRSGPATARSTRSSAGTPRSAASSRCCPGGPRTTPS